MNRSQKAIRRDKRSWKILAFVFALTVILGIARLLEGTGDITAVLVPVVLTGLCWYMSRYQGGKGRK